MINDRIQLKDHPYAWEIIPIPKEQPEMTAEVEFWKNLALYLADCHAATFFHE